MVTIYNTLTQRKEPLQPLEPGKVRLYVCGMTVYDFCHLGHARMLLAFDVVVRYLRFSGLDVTYVETLLTLMTKFWPVPSKTMSRSLRLPIAISLPCTKMRRHWR